MPKLWEQLPKMKMGTELLSSLEMIPPYDARIKEAGVTQRLLALSNLYNVYVPSAMSVEIYSKLYLAMLRSMQNKAGTLAVRQRYENHNRIRNQQHRGIIGGSDSFTIIGTSGIGKSTAIGRAITVATENRILEVSETSQKVIACLICQCPHDCSVKSMLLEILRRTDEIIGTDYCEKAIKARATTDMLIGNVSTVALNHIGLLIIDEIQNVVKHRQGDSLIGMLTQLINNSGISICMVGTPETESFFEQTDYLARRALGLSYEAMPYGTEFYDFCQVLYNYQYVKTAEPFSEGMAMWLYEHSRGVPALVVSLLHDVQESAILDGSDRLTMYALDELYKKRYGMMEKYNRSKQKTQQTPLPMAKPVETMLADDSFLLSSVVSGIKKQGLDCVAELRKYIKILEVDV